MRDILISGTRTGVQALVAFIVAGFADIGIAVDANALEKVLMAVVVGIVTMAINAAASKVDWIGKVTSLGLTASTPEYR